ncbi:hypothetical protein KAR91_50645 [Candidatus Pacearchaeota archaeon]|nr:hypothetical protein [Candidatus Pacearchaeota archaeon]
MKEWRRLAEIMFPAEVLPPEIEDRLERVDALIKKAKPDGRLASSQVVAMIIEQWQRELQP